MPTVQILNSTKYGKALRLLFSIGGMFRTMPTRTLMIDSVQYQALIDAGIVESDGKEVKGRGKKKKKV